jgi:RNA polymerase sigma-32 factor
MLTLREEFMLLNCWREGDARVKAEAAHVLIYCHQPLVGSIAKKHRGYNFPHAELVSAGNIGLIQALKKFNPNKGCRLNTYARHWIRGAIRAYIMRSRSLVKIGTTKNERKLFWKLGAAMMMISAQDEIDIYWLNKHNLRPDQVKRIAEAQRD